MLFGIKNILVASDYPIWTFIIGVFFAIIFSIYSYNRTIPNLSKPKKIPLILLRFSAILLLIALLFNIKLTFKLNTIKKSYPYIFVDNSSSISSKDSVEINKYFGNKSNDEIKLFNFGDSVRIAHNSNFSFKDKSTNYNDIFKYLGNKDDVNSVYILTDGNLNSGADPLYKDYSFGFPVNTILLGDTNSYKDISITNIFFDKKPLLNKNNKLAVDVEKTFPENSTVKIDLIENGKLISTKTVNLKNKFNRIFYDYKPVSKGFKNISVKVNSGFNEKNFANNIISKYINVKENKTKIALIGTPSYDYNFINNILKKNEDFQIYTFFDIYGNSSFTNLNSIDKSDLLIICGFPGKRLNKTLLSKVISNVKKGKKFLFIFSSGLDLSKSKIIEEITGIKSSLIGKNYFPVTNISLSEKNNLLSDLLPIDFNIPFVFSPVINSINNENIFLKGKINGKDVPLLFDINDNLILSGSGIWKWKLKLFDEAPLFANKFIFDCVNYLINKKKKLPVKISTNKLNYSNNEDVNFEANVLDRYNRPIDSASVKIILNDKSFYLSKISNTRFERTIKDLAPGRYNYKAEVIKSDKVIYTYNGSFSISEFDLEDINKQADKNYLYKLSKKYKGNLLTLDDFKKSELKQSEKIIQKNSYIKFWPNNIIILFIILFFTFEWFLRKRWGLL